jgi:branched-subunit amino acid aminotransferase/4-amino-4-deoxychorismate lyase
LNAEEMFVCNSVIGLWPVKRIDDHVFQAKKTLTAKLLTHLKDYPGFEV